MGANSSAIYFLTGFPGFLCSETLPLLLQGSEGSRAYLFIQSKFKAAAVQKIKEMSQGSDLESRVEFIEGDLCKTDLGISKETQNRLQAEITDIYHFAAVYDLSVRRDLAFEINVLGTERLLELAKSCPSLRCFHHISTCYVSGRYPGVFKETDLDVHQTFNNYYEETKFLAEKKVQAARDQGLPTIVYRPGIVVGNSKTGATQKYDGPYFVIRYLLKQPGFAALPKLGAEESTQLNLVPSDLVVHAIASIGLNPKNIGLTFQLADPQASTIQEIIDILSLHTQRRVFLVPLPASLTKAVLRSWVGRSLLKIPAETLDYFTHPTRYATDHFESAMADQGGAIPSFKDYAEKIVQFVKDHPDVRSHALI
jgi:thioester reductase-like protein